MMPIDDDKDAERRRKPHARINKNLLNRPLARDCRVKAEWEFSEKHERWYCNLPGRKYVRYRLPGDAERRLPEGFDVAVLFLILRKARMSKSRKVAFASQAAMLRDLRVAVRVRYRRKLKDALTLLSQMSIRWDWYREAQYKSLPGAFGEYGGHFHGEWIQPEGVKTRYYTPQLKERLRPLVEEMR